MHRIRRWTALLLFGLVVISCVWAGASSISGQSYDLFYQYYKENVDFINQNDNRHLLPLVLVNRGDVLGDGRLTYELIGDVLNVTILTDTARQVIERCEIMLTAPSGMEYGNALYNDFAISGYHSYAFLMAMHTDGDPARRYELVTDIVSGLSASDGTYARQLGVYTIECTRSQDAATIIFQNNRAETTPTPDTESDAGAIALPLA